MTRRLIIILAALLALSACTPKNKVQEDAQAPPPPVSETPMEAVPDTLDYDFLAEEDTGEIEEIPAEADLPVIEKPAEVEEVIWTIPEEVEEPQATEGLFWVQIFATRSHERAKEIAAEAEDRLSHRIETHFLSPYYKVLVGGFTTREEAVKLRDRLVSKGYRDAWIFEL